MNAGGGQCALSTQVRAFAAHHSRLGGAVGQSPRIKTMQGFRLQFIPARGARDIFQLQSSS